MTILVAADFTPEEWAQWLPALKRALPGETLVTERSDSVDIAIVANPPASVLRDLPQLKLVQSLWAGVEKLLDDPTLPADVPLARMVDPAMNEAMAETALWAVLSMQRDFFTYAQQQGKACWLPHGQRRAESLRVTVLGLGQMGRAVAERLARNGYRVTGWSTRETRIDGVQTLSGEAQLSNALMAADVAVNLLPLTAATRGLLDARTLAWLPRGAALVNLARGAHVVEADLLAALDNGQIGHAVLDVFATEPLPSGHPFWAHPRVTVLPHVAAQTDVQSASAVAARNIAALRANRPLENLVQRTRGY